MEKYYKELNQIYDSVKEGNCKGCTRCCSESVNMSYIEFRNVYDHCFKEQGILSNPDLVRRIMRYYFLELVVPMKCPFLNAENRCDIYAYRPLPCRIFGNATKKAYDRNYRAIKIQNFNTAKYLYEEEGLMIPKSVLRKEIGFCNDYEPVAQLDDQVIAAFYDRLINMDGVMVFEGKMKPTQFNQNLVGWFVELILEEINGSVVTKDLLETLRLDALKSLNLRGHLF